MTALWYGRWDGKTQNSTWQTGMYFETDTLIPSAAKNLWDGATQTFWNAGTTHAFGYKSFCGHATGMLTAETYSVDISTDIKTLVGQSSWGDFGSSAATQAPEQACPMILLRTQTSAFSSTGRMFLPAVAVDHVSAGLLSVTDQGLTMDFFTDIFTDFRTNLAFPVVRSRSRHTHARAAQLVMDRRFMTVPTREPGSAMTPALRSIPTS